MPRIKEVLDDDYPLLATPINPSAFDALLKKHLLALINRSIGKQALMAVDRAGDLFPTGCRYAPSPRSLQAAAYDQRCYLPEELLL